MGLQCGGKVLPSPWPEFRILSSKVTILGICRTAAGKFLRGGWIHSGVTPLADGVRAGNRRPFAEDGTVFSSSATGASARSPGCDCGRVVVACHADHARARPDRSR